MELFVDGGDKIVDENKKELTIQQARIAWENGLVDNYNLAFRKLASFDFDFDKLNEFYRKQSFNRRKDV